MTRWAQILTSGSAASVLNITASNLPNITGTSKESLLFTRNDGQFRTSSQIFYTSSAGGQLVLENVNLNTSTITASNLPDQIQDNANIVFINEGGGFETTSSLKYINNKIEFNGTFSGSFMGDGSGLTGVTAITPASLNSSLGLGKSGSLDPFSFNGSNKVVAQVITASGGGIEYAAGGIRSRQM